MRMCSKALRTKPILKVNRLRNRLATLAQTFLDLNTDLSQPPPLPLRSVNEDADEELVYQGQRPVRQVVHPASERT